jgi:hypothetical protein
MKLFASSTTPFLKGAVSILGCLGVCALTATTAAAENASVSGAVTYTRPAGYSLSFSAEKVAPSGYQFDGAITVTAVPGTGVDAAPTGMTLNAGTSTVIGTAPTGAVTLKDAVITKLNSFTDVTAPTNLDAYTAILKAAAGTDGLE